MDDSLERDQLNLWEKLNRLYGEKSGENAEPEDAGTASEQSVADVPEDTEKPGVELDSMALEEVQLAPGFQEASPESGRINEVCADCRYDCTQPAGNFVIDRCRLAKESKPDNRSATVNQVAASAGSMGIEKINETCRRCRRSCKQRTSKLNKMLCLGFVPIENGRSEHD